MLVMLILILGVVYADSDGIESTIEKSSSFNVSEKNINSLIKKKEKFDENGDLEIFYKGIGLLDDKEKIDDLELKIKDTIAINDNINARAAQTVDFKEFLKESEISFISLIKDKNNKSKVIMDTLLRNGEYRSGLSDIYDEELFEILFSKNRQAKLLKDLGVKKVEDYGIGRYRLLHTYFIYYKVDGEYYVVPISEGQDVYDKNRIYETKDFFDLMYRGFDRSILIDAEEPKPGGLSSQISMNYYSGILLLIVAVVSTFIFRNRIFKKNY